MPGITGPIALYCTFLLGVLITYEFYIPAIAGAVIITLLLAEKAPLHSFATNLTNDEILSGVRFLAVVFILYPITPDELFMGVINPRTILQIVIIVATISFISFVIMKEIGTKRGLPVSGMLGGLVNSQATTGALAAMAKKRTELIESSYLGIILSNAATLARNMVIALIVDPSGKVLLLMAPVQIVIILFLAATAIKSSNHMVSNETIQLQSPFALSPAVKFAFGFTALSFISRFAYLWAGVAGVYATALGGFISSAVVIASVTALAVNHTVSYNTAAITVVLASIISVGSNMIFVKLSGPPELMQLIKKSFTRFIIFGTVVLIIWAILINHNF